MYIRSLLVLALLAGPALAGDSPEPVSPDPLWFRLESQGLTILGYLDESQGKRTGHDRAMLDAGAPGEPWLSIPLFEEPESEHYDRVPVVGLQVGEQSHWLYLSGLTERERQPDGSYHCEINQSVRQGGLLLEFRNGVGRLYADRVRAEKGKPIRLGGPFSLDVSTSTRGWDPLICVGIVDGNGCRLCLALVEVEDREVGVMLLSRRAIVLSDTMDCGEDGTLEIPVSVPPGEYLVRATIDLAPIHERLTIIEKIRIESPPANLPDRWLAHLESSDANVRRKAIRELSRFPGEGARIRPALLTATKDPDIGVRVGALQAFLRIPEQAALHWAEFLAIARNDDTMPVERVAAAWLLAHTSPEDREVEVLLRKLTRADGQIRHHYEGLLTTYRERLRREKPAEDPR